MEDLKVTLIQTALFWENRMKNLGHFDSLIDSIKEETDLVLLPETFNTGFSINPGLFAEDMDGPSLGFLRSKAQEKRVSIMTSLMIREENAVFNRLVFVRPDGNIDTYDKRHLFRLSEEYKLFNGGNSRKIMSLNGWKILPLVCYDLRFPVWSKNTFENGNYEYDLLIYIANWPASRSHVWKTLLMARGIENQSYSVGVNRIGSDGNGTAHTGDSMVSDSKGNIIFAAGPGSETIQTVTLKASDLKIFRESFTVGMDWDKFSIKS